MVEYNTPAYYFDLDEFNHRALSVKKALGMIPITYSVKANPFLLARLPECISNVEVCSPGELNICIKMGISPEMVVYSGVNKGVEDIEAAIEYGVGIVSVESLSQLHMVQLVANKYGIKQKVILRLTSGNQFGIDKLELIKAIDTMALYKNLIIIGIHFYAGTQKKIKQIEEDLASLSGILEEIRLKTGFVPELVELGPGLRFEYFGSECEKKEKEYLNCVSTLISEFGQEYTVSVEMGRFLAAPCGTYATRVKDIKTNDKTKYVICDGGIHHLSYYGQTLGMQVPRLEVLRLAENTDFYCICGSLCTAADILVKRVELPVLELNDVILFHNCGAYSVSEGISLFLSRNLPEVYLCSKDGEAQRIRPSIETYKFNMP